MVVVEYDRKNGGKFCEKGGNLLRSLRNALCLPLQEETNSRPKITTICLENKKVKAQ
jgi:hypothetical protein